MMPQQQDTRSKSQAKSIVWERVVLSVRGSWMTATPHKAVPTSEKFDRDLYRCFTARNEYELTVLYTLLKRCIESSVDLDQQVH